ncbi:MAG: hypothetical protein JXA73_20305 [Acidobacteria bacterium]|nr:hypothetical protein [Acidobacteriota bacterium]
MATIKYITYCTGRVWPACILLFFYVCAAPAQTLQIIHWQESLLYLQKASNDELLLETSTVEKIRAGVELWLSLHPKSLINLSPAPLKAWSPEEIRGQIALLLKTVQTILREDPGRPFDLGTILEERNNEMLR